MLRGMAAEFFPAPESRGRRIDAWHLGGGSAPASPARPRTSPLDGHVSARNSAAETVGGRIYLGRRPLLAVELDAHPRSNWRGRTDGDRLRDDHAAKGGGVIAGPEWKLEDLLGGGIIDRSNVTLTLGPDGQASGSGGCNRFFGSWSVKGSALSLGAMA